jgi:hypothetical protein
VIATNLDRACATHEASLYLRWAAEGLNPTERAALDAYALDLPLSHVAGQLGVTRGGAWMAQQSGLARMRRRLVALGITSAEDLLL